MLLDRLLTEVRTPPPPPSPSPEPVVEGEEVVPAWVAEDPYGAEGEGEFAQQKQDEALEEDDDKADMRSLNPYAAEKYYQDSIEHHFHKQT